MSLWGTVTVFVDVFYNVLFLLFFPVAPHCHAHFIVLSVIHPFPPDSYRGRIFWVLWWNVTHGGALFLSGVSGYSGLRTHPHKLTTCQGLYLLVIWIWAPPLGRSGFTRPGLYQSLMQPCAEGVSWWTPLLDRAPGSALSFHLPCMSRTVTWLACTSIHFVVLAGQLYWYLDSLAPLREGILKTHYWGSVLIAPSRVRLSLAVLCSAPPLPFLLQPTGAASVDKHPGVLFTFCFCDWTTWAKATWRGEGLFQLTVYSLSLREVRTGTWGGGSWRRGCGGMLLPGLALMAHPLVSLMTPGPLDQG